MFEIDFFFACLWFIEQKVDIAVIEVGLGGLLDSTNTLRHPLCSVIVSIGLDHMERLGNTEEAIALQKAGIIKTGGLVVSGVTQPECQAVIKTVCAEKLARLIPVPVVTVQPDPRFTLRWRIRPIRCIPCSISGPQRGGGPDVSAGLEAAGSVDPQRESAAPRTAESSLGPAV